MCSPCFGAASQLSLECACSGTQEWYCCKEASLLLRVLTFLSPERAQWAGKGSFPRESPAIAITQHTAHPRPPPLPADLSRPKISTVGPLTRDQVSQLMLCFLLLQVGKGGAVSPAPAHAHTLASLRQLNPSPGFTKAAAVFSYFSCCPWLFFMPWTLRNQAQNPGVPGAVV